MASRVFLQCTFQPVKFTFSKHQFPKHQCYTNQLFGVKWVGDTRIMFFPEVFDSSISVPLMTRCREVKVSKLSCGNFEFNTEGNVPTRWVEMFGDFGLDFTSTHVLPKIEYGSIEVGRWDCFVSGLSIEEKHSLGRIFDDVMAHKVSYTLPNVDLKRVRIPSNQFFSMAKGKIFPYSNLIEASCFAEEEGCFPVNYCYSRPWRFFYLSRNNILPVLPKVHAFQNDDGSLTISNDDPLCYEEVVVLGEAIKKLC
jgi:hypothetical protein